jgi:hypothetical protein
MLKISSATREPVWLDIMDGVRIRLKPVTIAAMLVARERVLEELGKLPPETDEDERNAFLSAALTRHLARLGVVEWEGIIGPDGEPAPVTRENIDSVLSVWQVFDKVNRLYVSPYLALDAEKNASAPSPNGVLAGAADIARPAEQSVPSALHA